MLSAPDQLLRRLEWRLGRRLDGHLQGAYRSLWHGAGLDFTDLRPYTLQDDVRHIDWNVTARLDEPHVRQYTQERDITAWLVVDRSASMRVGRTPKGGRGPGQGKEVLATELAVLMARLLSGDGNRIGAVLFDNAERKVIPPRTGRQQILRITGELLRPAKPSTGKRPRGKSAEPGTDLGGMLRLAASTARRRSLILVVSDFIGDPGWDLPLGTLAQRHEVAVIRVVDPAELEIPDLGTIVVQDAETGEQLLVDTGDPLLRSRLAQQVAERESALAGAFNRAGVTAHRISTDQDLVAAFIALVGKSSRVGTHRR